MLAAMHVSDDLVEVRLLGVPIDVMRRSQEHQQRLQDALAVIDVPPDAVPSRLNAVTEELQARYGTLAIEPELTIAKAMSEGSDTVDVTYLVPGEVRDASVQLDRLLDEMDDFCRRGELSGVASDPELVAFRKWFLGQFVDQIDGRPATAWHDWTGPS